MYYEDSSGSDTMQNPQSFSINPFIIVHIRNLDINARIIHDEFAKWTKARSNCRHTTSVTHGLGKAGNRRLAVPIGVTTYDTCVNETNTELVREIQLSLLAPSFGRASRSLLFAIAAHRRSSPLCLVLMMDEI